MVTTFRAQIHMAVSVVDKSSKHQADNVRKFSIRAQAPFSIKDPDLIKLLASILSPKEFKVKKFWFVMMPQKR